MAQMSKRIAMWLRVAGVLALLAAGAALLLSGCSSSPTPRDISYGTDVGLGYLPPGTSVSGAADGAPTGGTTRSDGGSAGEAPALYDAGVETRRTDSSRASRDAWPAADSGSAPTDVRARDSVSASDGGLGVDSGIVSGTPCSPTCSGVACGSPDGCGGTCSIGCVCVPTCGGVLCGGSDGCGGVCAFGCICIPYCGPLDCGTFDGCGGTCMSGCYCTPRCGGDDCGTPDGCGGTYDDGCYCSPSCGAFDCGASDGCGGTCDDGCWVLD